MTLLLISDFYYKTIDRLRDYIFWLCWWIKLGSLGKGSFIKRGVKINGNPRRIIIGKNFKIWENCFLGVGKGHIHIGNDGLLGVNSYINSSNGMVKIGNNVAIAPFCQFYTYSHHYEGASKVTDTYITGDIIIEDNVFIGSNVIILPGVTIHKNSVIAAGSIVNKDVESNKVYGGVPAKPIKNIEN